ncbi:hypothetical protein QWY16_10895 [Planococcus shenhongbingii]|uniref:Uncharacterized protein n=1 Tax=Planococcus shenhongbingii TaxID=3058398 RepID=A0ABT8NGX4_9BACL|nr:MULTISPECIES: hypothetical protein [unclassified Planococcus (in: firmicutes)]MDN7247152.1 hypothetical protein [Planococcus sp. N017]WKA57019.1 hypothetical protein QWY16_10895 [Planococcus sp. N016]
MRKLIVAVPLLTLVCLITLVISVNIRDSESPKIQEEVVQATESEKLEMSKHNPANPKGYGQQIESSSFGEPKDLVLSIHGKWNSLSVEEQYSISPDSESYRLISSVVSEINFARSNMDSEMIPKFDSLQETAHKLTSPVIELPEEERRSLIPRFESQLDELYAIMMNR